MQQPFDLICATEDALQALEALELDNDPQPLLQNEVRRLEGKLEFLNSLEPLFEQPASIAVE